MNKECLWCQNDIPFELPDEIIEATLKGELVLFCGAGVSTEGKTVLPNSFYSEIQAELGESDNTVCFSELMQRYCNQPNGRKKLLNRIRERFQYIHSFPELERQATRFHRELSEIYPIKTIVTTNWDTYFEKMSGAIPITIPEDFAFWDEQSRFVLKIHGSISNLGSIIATSEDYKMCYRQLQNGIIGATLKTILSTKTVVFIGFSFGDEDFSQIIEYLRNEMGDLYPYIYIVTLDSSLKERLNYNNCTVINTSGTYFLQQLKESLIEKKVIKNCNILPEINTALEIARILHREVSKIDLMNYPSVIYTLSYQDGIIHAWERYLQCYCSGEYNCPGYIERVINSYEGLAENARKNKNYWDMAYCNGYVNAVCYIDLCETREDMDPEFPFFYLPGRELCETDREKYLDEMERFSKGKSKYAVYARELVKKKIGDGIVVHHPPYLA